MNDPITITITEVVGRAVQGMTKPFLCKAGFFDYDVKGAYAGLDSLCCEWERTLIRRRLSAMPGQDIEGPTLNVEVERIGAWRRRGEQGGVDCLRPCGMRFAIYKSS